MKTSFKRIQIFAANANKYLQENPAETKISYALKKVGERVNIEIQKYRELKEEIDIDLANTDSNGSLLYKETPTGREYEFTKDSMKTRIVRLKTLYEAETFEIKGHFVADIPEAIGQELREVFEGFVIQPVVKTQE